jgi:protein subunit release factor B
MAINWSLRADGTERGTAESSAATRGSRNGSAAAGTVTPESSNSQPSTPTSQLAISAGRSSGIAR